MAISIKPPEFLEKLAINIPDRLPFEDKVNDGLNKLAEKTNNSSLTRQATKIHDKLPVFEESRFNTPFGQIKLPELSAPVPKAPKMDERTKDAMKGAVATDAAFLVGFIPVVGDFAANVISDTYLLKINLTLTDSEFKDYMKYNKLGPSTYAMVRTLIKR